MECVAVVMDSLTLSAEILRSCKAALVPAAQRLLSHHRAGEEARRGGVSLVLVMGWMCCQIPLVTALLAPGRERNINFTAETRVVV